MRTELDSGAWVEHRPLQDLKAKDKDAVSRSVKMAMPLTAEGEVDMSAGVSIGGEMQIAARNAVLARVITAWSFDAPVPVYENWQITNVESIDEIPIDDFNEIEDLFDPYLAKLRKRPDPKAPAAGTTTASNGSSRANVVPGSPAG